MPFTCGLTVFLCRVPRPHKPTLLPQCHKPLRGRVSRDYNHALKAPPISTGLVPPTLFAAAYMVTSS